MPIAQSQTQFGQQTYMSIASKENQVELNMPKKLDMNVLIEIAANKTSITKPALAAFDYAFADEIKAGLFNDGSYNLYGRSMNG